MKSTRSIAFGALLAAFAGLPLAAEAELGVDDAYVRMTPPGARVSAAFMVITNPTRVTRKLVRAQSPAAKAVELHTHKVHDGYMQMRKVEAIEVTAGGRVELKPGSFHLMLIDFRGGKENDSVPITLFFDDGSSKRIAAPLRRDTPTTAGSAAHEATGGRH